MTVDPGIHTAVAFFPAGKNIPDSIATFTTRDKTAERQIYELSKHFTAVLGSLEEQFHYGRGINVYIEGVEIYRNSIKSMTSATRGNLSLLAYIVGAYVQDVYNDYNKPVIVSPQWKGQLNYKALAIWVKRIINKEYKTEHELAAVGIGLAVRGLLI